MCPPAPHALCGLVSLQPQEADPFSLRSALYRSPVSFRLLLFGPSYTSNGVFKKIWQNDTEIFFYLFGLNLYLSKNCFLITTNIRYYR